MGNSIINSSQTAVDLMLLGFKKVIKPESCRETQNEPPAECPMHKSYQLNTINYTNECPIDQMDNNDINPLNMVCIMQNLFTN